MIYTSLYFSSSYVILELGKPRVYAKIQAGFLMEVIRLSSEDFFSSQDEHFSFLVQVLRYKYF